MTRDVPSEVLFYVISSAEPGACERHASLEDALRAAERLMTCGRDVRVVSRKRAQTPAMTDA